MLFAFCGSGLLLMGAGFYGLCLLTKRTEPTGCIIFFTMLFLTCLAGMVVPQLFF